MKVYLQYPWKFPDSPYYKYLIDSLPDGIEYLNVKKVIKRCDERRKVI